MHRAARARLVVRRADRSIALTERGAVEARRMVRNHRLWETYLINFADIAPSHVDRDADQVEHVLGPAMIDRLERLLAASMAPAHVPPSPHPIPAKGKARGRRP